MSPSVLRATVRLHPAVTLLVLVLVGAVAGFWGIVIAVPLTAALKIIVGYWWRTRILDQSPHDAAESMFIEPPKRKSWTREMDVVTVPAAPASPAPSAPAPRLRMKMLWTEAPSRKRHQTVNSECPTAAL